MNKTGNFELFFEYSTTSVLTIKVVTDVVATPMFSLNTDVLYPISLLILSDDRIDGSSWIVIKLKLGDIVIETSDFQVGSPFMDKFKIRVFLSDDKLAVYCNGKIVYFYSFSSVSYPTPVNVSIFAIGDSVTLLNIRRTELCDMRNAVYIDYEATADSAIQSVIQQRPVQISVDSERATRFTYNAIGGIIDAHHIGKYMEDIQRNPQISSDGIVYFSDVAVAISTKTAKEVGLITKLYRLSELDSGALRAAKVMQQQALERRNSPSVIMRLDPRIEVMDNLIVDMIVTGTETHVEDSIIVEDVQLSVSDGQYSMTIQGRRKK